MIKKIDEGTLIIKYDKETQSMFLFLYDVLRIKNDKVFFLFTTYFLSSAKKEKGTYSICCYEDYDEFCERVEKRLKTDLTIITLNDKKEIENNIQAEALLLRKVFPDKSFFKNRRHAINYISDKYFVDKNTFLFFMGNNQDAMPMGEQEEINKEFPPIELKISEISMNFMVQE